MYYLNKIVGVLMSPSVLLMLVCIGSAWRLFRTSNLKPQTSNASRALQKFAFCIAFGALWFWMSAIPARILGLPLEREWLVDGEIPTAEGFPKADAIVCLGGGVGVATNVVHGANICPASDRAWMVARLWKAGKAPKIICTGRTSRASTLGLLMDFGVPESAITFLEDARNTEEEAKSVQSLMFEVGGLAQTSNFKPQTSILLVTSSWHMRRAKLMFEKYAKGVEVIPAPTDFEATVEFDDGFEFRELQPGTAFMNETYLREWIGYLGYKWLRR